MMLSQSFMSNRMPPGGYGQLNGAVANQMLPNIIKGRTSLRDSHVPFRVMNTTQMSESCDMSSIQNQSVDLGRMQTDRPRLINRIEMPDLLT